MSSSLTNYVTIIQLLNNLFNFSFPLSINSSYSSYFMFNFNAILVLGKKISTSDIFGNSYILFL